MPSGVYKRNTGMMNTIGISRRTQLHNERKLLGVCVRHPFSKVVEGRTICIKCIEYHNYYYHNKTTETAMVRKREVEAIRMQTPPGKYGLYKRNARQGEYVFEITFEEFKDFWQKPCGYCGSEIATIGIDRIDNSVGYVRGNVVACCEQCNKMKWRYTKEAFIRQCQKVVDHVNK